MKIPDNSKMFQLNIKEEIGEEIFNKLGVFYQKPSFIYIEYTPVKNTNNLSFDINYNVLVGELVKDGELDELSIEDYTEGLKNNINWILNNEGNNTND